MFIAYDGPLQYSASQGYADVGPYTERKDSEGIINGMYNGMYKMLCIKLFKYKNI